MHISLPSIKAAIQQYPDTLTSLPTAVFCISLLSPPSLCRTAPPCSPDAFKLLRFLSVLSDLGYRLFHSEPNLLAPGCFELAFVHETLVT